VWERFQFVSNKEANAVLEVDDITTDVRVQLRLTNGYDGTRFVTTVTQPCKEYRDARNKHSTKLIIHTRNWKPAMTASYASTYIFERVEGKERTFYIKADCDGKEYYVAAHGHKQSGESDKRGPNSTYACSHAPKEDGSWKTQWSVEPIEGKPGIFKLRAENHQEQGRYLAAHFGGEGGTQYPDFRNAGSSYVMVHKAGLRPHAGAARGGGVYEGEWAIELVA